MFIEKYQPYTQFIITYNGEEITEDNPVTLPNVVKGEYKVNLDAIGYNREDDRENLPFTRNGLTWWLEDTAEDVLAKEIIIDEVGTKFTIDDSGTLSIVSPSYSAPENSSINVICVLGKPRTLNLEEFDFNTEIFGSEVLPFSSGGSGGSSDFTTATVKFISTKGIYSVAGSFVFGTDTIVSSKITVEQLSPPMELIIPLYKGSAIYSLRAFGDVQSTPIVTGGITVFNEGIRITGDGTYSADGLEGNAPISH